MGQPRPTSRMAAGLVLVISLLVAAPVLAGQRSEKDQRRDLLYVLNAHEFRVDERVLKGIGPEVNRLLVLISSEPKQRPAVRGNAVAALSVFPSHRTRRYLESLLDERSLVGTPAGTLIRRQAMRSLGVAFRGEVVSVLVSMKSDKNPQIREGCAHALADTGSTLALEPLEGWLPHEKELFVRLAVDRAIASIKRAERKR